MRIALAVCLSAVLLFAACSQNQGTGPLLDKNDRKYVQGSLEALEKDVRLILFTGIQDCTFCDAAEGFLNEIAAENSRVSVEILSLKKDSALAGELGIDKAPGIAVIGPADFGVRYYGLPTGHEFTTFVDTIRSVGNADSGLAPESAEALAALKKPVTITVFSTKS